MRDLIADPLAASKSHVYVAAAAAKTLHAETLRRVSSLPTASSLAASVVSILPFPAPPSLANVNPSGNSSQRGRDSVLEAGGKSRRGKSAPAPAVSAQESLVGLKQPPPQPFVPGGVRGRPPLPKALKDQAAHHTAIAVAANEEVTGGPKKKRRGQPVEKEHGGEPEGVPVVEGPSERVSSRGRVSKPNRWYE